MSPGESTQRPEFDRNGHNRDASETSDAWSFGSRKRLFTPLKPPRPIEPGAERSAAANITGSPTRDAQIPVDVSGVKPVEPPSPHFGKRGFAPLYQWEGVVEEVNGESFRARLRPFEDGRPDPSSVEYADFAYTDLADESDHEYVTEGAVFYWTIGKSRNEYGTYTNTSLVRFRRLPPPTPKQLREAAREADALLAELADDR